MDIPLVNADLAVSLISRSELAVGHSIIIERKFADKNHERAELLPLTILVARYSHCKSISYIGFGEFMPFVYIETCITSLGSDAAAMLVAYFRKDFRIFFRKVEVQWCDSGRNSHTDIIREDLRQFFTEHGLPTAGNQKETNYRERCLYECLHYLLHFSLGPSKPDSTRQPRHCSYSGDIIWPASCPFQDRNTGNPPDNVLT